MSAVARGAVTSEPGERRRRCPEDESAHRARVAENDGLLSEIRQSAVGARSRRARATPTRTTRHKRPRRHTPSPSLPSNGPRPHHGRGVRTNRPERPELEFKVLICQNLTCERAKKQGPRDQPQATARRRRRRRADARAAARDRPASGSARRPGGLCQRPGRRSAHGRTERPWPTGAAVEGPIFRGGGSVDHAANGFNPTEILRDFDYGTTRRLASGRVLREWELVAFDKEIEVAPGVRFPAWTYNGRVPGPTLRCREGELLRIRFTNGSQHPHTIHFHGLHPSVMDGVPDIGGAGSSGRASRPPTSSPRSRSGSTSTTATLGRSPSTSPAGSTGPSSSIPSRAARTRTSW